VEFVTYLSLGRSLLLQSIRNIICFTSRYFDCSPDLNNYLSVPSPPCHSLCLHMHATFQRSPQQRTCDETNLASPFTRSQFPLHLTAGREIHSSHPSPITRSYRSRFKGFKSSFLNHAPCATETCDWILEYTYIYGGLVGRKYSFRSTKAVLFLQNRYRCYLT
jgi:hypothetical protein